MEQPSKRIHQRTWETYHHCHRGSKRDKLYLSANLSGNSERQDAVSHWVIHHRHGLNNNNINSNASDDNNSINKQRQCPYDNSVTEDTKEFLAFLWRQISARFQYKNNNNNKKKKKNKNNNNTLSHN